MMNKPKKQWVTEIEKGIAVAISFAEKRNEDISNIFKYAISHAVEAMGLEDLDSIEEIEEYIGELIDQDWSCDPESKNRYKFHYASTYIFSHVPPGFLEEMEADQIMEYVNDEIDLFT